MSGRELPVVARIVTRLTDDKDGLCLMTLMKTHGRKHFKPETVYEIVEVLGELQIIEVGPSIVKSGEPMVPGLHWGRSVSDILSEGGAYLWLSQDEYKAWCTRTA